MNKEKKRQNKRRKMRRNRPRYLLEAAALYLLFGLFKLLPVNAASGLGGFLGRAIGPRLAASRKAMRHVTSALPQADAAQVVRDMWDNLGRTIAEYPHLRSLIARSEIHGYLPEDHTQYVFFSGHLSNWEIPATSMNHFFSATPHLVYRAPNNPYVQGLLNRCRSLNGKISTIAKSKTGMRDVVRVLQQGESLGILIDQKYNQGIEADFFGQPAMTSTAFAQLAQKFDIPLIPVRPERIHGSHFRITIYPPIPTKGRPIEDIVAQAHGLLESWITERPGQWLWLHRRWVKGQVNE